MSNRPGKKQPTKLLFQTTACRSRKKKQKNQQSYTQQQYSPSPYHTILEKQ
jgi:hypothetical protein